MHMDGAALYAATHEINEQLLDGRIERIAMPNRNDCILTIRALGKNHRLLISVDPQAARMHLCGPAEPGPEQPFVFLMLLRKYLVHGRILGFDVPQMDRVCRIRVGVVNDLGDRVERLLIAELMGKHSNLILVDESGHVVDSARRVTPSMSSLRTVLPGDTYQAPPSQQKQNLLAQSEEDLQSFLAGLSGGSVQTHLVDAFYGLSPFTAQQLCERAGFGSALYAPLSKDACSRLAQACTTFVDALTHGAFTPCLLLGPDGIPAGFSPFTIASMPCDPVPRFQDALLTYYQAHRTSQQLLRERTALLSSVSARLQRLYKRLQIQNDTLQKSAEFETIRTQGELLLAYAYQIRRGAATATVYDYTQDKEVTLTLDPQLSAADNAAKRFKRYQKLKSAQIAAQAQKDEIAPEIEYLEGIQFALEQCETVEEVREIRGELQDQGILHVTQKQKGKHEPQLSKPVHLRSSEGVDVYCGRNNAQNDFVTLKLSRSTDTWLHVQGMPGSHVLIKAHPAPQQTLLEAAQVAAFYSRARNSSNVPVDYTLVKFVRKPSGAKPGFVTYTSQKTLFVTPDAELVKSLICKER